MFGGNLDYESPSQTWKGLDRVFTFNPWTETWKERPAHGPRPLVPTGVRLPDGRVPIMSGLDESGQLIPHSNTVQEVELFTPSADLGGVGTIKTIGSIGTGLDDERAKKPLGNLYPRMVVMADGHAYTAGPDRDQTWVLDDPDATPTFSWHDIPNMNRSRTWGTTVPLPSGPSGPTKLLAMGGTEFSGDPSTTTTELFDLNNPGSWQLQTGKDNLYGRGHANTVLLPDGSMVEVGGGRGNLDGFESAPALRRAREAPHRAVGPGHRRLDAWPGADGVAGVSLDRFAAPRRARDVRRRRLQRGPGQGRRQHRHGPMEDTAEIYKPPYLFRGPRPTITSIGTTPTTTDPPRACPSRLQRQLRRQHAGHQHHGRGARGAGRRHSRRRHEPALLELNVVQGTGCVSVTAPTGRNAAPPGTTCSFCSTIRACPPGRSS